MAKFEMFLASSLEKVFPDERPKELKDRNEILFSNDKWACQLVYYMEKENIWRDKYWFNIEIEGIEKELLTDCIKTVELVPSEFPAGNNCDTNYLRTTPGLYPDLLRNCEDGRAYFMSGQYRSIWIDIPVNKMKPGNYNITFKIILDKEKKLGNGEMVLSTDVDKFVYEESINLLILSKELPKQKLIHTQWFHTDCLADYYNVPVWSKEHWNCIENFIRFATKKAGINMILTPVFTPPLDTNVGGKRTTVQLVDVNKQGEEYTFDFSKLKKWCEICLKYQVDYIELPQFFTQWGAYATPYIECTQDGNKKQIFGWNVKAEDKEYKKFLSCFIPKLIEFLEQCKYGKDKLYFHVSDEPIEKHLEAYSKARKIVEPYLKGCNIIDALSEYSFYEKGVIDVPIPTNDKVEEFYIHGVKPFWTYYCVCQGYLVPNRFFSMPSQRNAIMGVLMYLYDAQGFLHWGYNFYNSQYSLEHINPYLNTDASKAFISGDAFLVYPGKNFEPETSIRNEVQMGWLADLRAFRLLETLIGREEVIKIIYEGVEEKITFTNYPVSSDYILALRRKIRKRIKENLD